MRTLMTTIMIVVGVALLLIDVFRYPDAQPEKAGAESRSAAEAPSA